MRVPTVLLRFALQIVEEVEDERCGELLDLDSARSHAEALGGEADQELEAVGVAQHRMVAGVSVRGAGVGAGTRRGARRVRSWRSPPRVGVLGFAGDVAKQNGRGLEVPVGGGDVVVTEIGRQRQHVPVGAVAVGGDGVFE